MAECKKALESKQDSIWLGIAEKDVDLNTLTQIGTIAIHGTSANVPPDIITTNWGLLSISANSKDGKAACTQHLSIMVSEGHFPNVYERNWNGINWSKWARIATALPPEEIPLQLAEGLQPTSKSVLFKNQFGEVHVHGAVSAGDGVIGWSQTIGTLPEGYRPSAQMEFGASFATDGVNCAGAVSISTDGVIQAYPDISTPQKVVYFDLFFYG